MNLPILAQSYADMLTSADTEVKRSTVAIDTALAEEGARLVEGMRNRWWRPSDGAAAVERALATEAHIQERCRETMAIVRDEPWKIGSIGAQEAALTRALADHDASVERVAAMRAQQRQRAA